MYCEQRERNNATILECFGRFDEEDTNHFIQTLEQLHGQGVREYCDQFVTCVLL